MIKKIDHIGIAVKSIDESLKFYHNKLGLKYLGRELVEAEKVEVAFLQIGESKIELLQATAKDSPIAKFIEKRGQGIHHVAMACDNQAEFINSKGIECIEPKMRQGAHQCWVSFIHPKHSSGVLVELSQKQ